MDQGRILLGDAAAEQAGIESGMGVASARSLAPAITLIARNVAQETAAMQTLACWAGSFTPRVSLTDDTLLLEIGSCLSLFGGLRKLVAAVKNGMAAQHLTVAVAVAPTPLGAQWLARSGTAALCLDHKTMRNYLDALSVDVLPAKVASSLARFGAATLADVARLPSAALSRRIGTEALQLMSRAFGDMPDPRPDFVFPDQFALALELPASVESAAALLFAARRLTAALSGWLIARQAGVRDISLLLYHRDECTDVVLRFANVTSDAVRFERILREQLERLTLQAPVESMQLVAANVVRSPGRSRTLFVDVHEQQDAIGTLLERLSARLGEQQVYRPALQADHRPECADRHASPFGNMKQGDSILYPRPLWLLDKPEPLHVIDGMPCRRGPLKLLTGPERIESGWADDVAPVGDVRRDYFIAHAADEQCLWIYRECQTRGGWFLHGFFA